MNDFQRGLKFLGEQAYEYHRARDHAHAYCDCPHEVCAGYRDALDSFGDLLAGFKDICENVDSLRADYGVKRT